MATYAVDSKRQSMVATGIVVAAKEWEDTPTGRRKSDVQARHPETGMPMWEVEVQYRTEVFGDPATVTHKVPVGHQTEPTFEPYTPITFAGLMVSANINKHKVFSERWSAEALDEFTPAGGESKPGARAAAPAKEKAA